MAIGRFDAAPTPRRPTPSDFGLNASPGSEAAGAGFKAIGGALTGLDEMLTKRAAAKIEAARKQREMELKEYKTQADVDVANAAQKVKEQEQNLKDEDAGRKVQEFTGTAAVQQFIKDNPKISYNELVKGALSVPHGVDPVPALGLIKPQSSSGGSTTKTSEDIKLARQHYKTLSERERTVGSDLQKAVDNFKEESSILSNQDMVAKLIETGQYASTLQNISEARRRMTDAQNELDNNKDKKRYYKGIIEYYYPGFDYEKADKFGLTDTKTDSLSTGTPIMDPKDDPSGLFR